MEVQRRVVMRERAVMHVNVSNSRGGVMHGNVSKSGSAGKQGMYENTGKSSNVRKEQ